MKYILGKKIGMTTLYGGDEALHVTLVECFGKVSLIRTKEKNGYDAVQLTMPFTKNKAVRREFRIENPGALQIKENDEVKVEIFEIGNKVSVRGKTKAKGFQGVVKRHGFSGSPKSHGHKHDLRAPGSIGSGFPEHVVKGKRMAGRMGGTNSVSKNVKVVFIDKEKSILGLKGAVPGVPGSVIEIYGKD